MKTYPDKQIDTKESLRKLFMVLGQKPPGQNPPRQNPPDKTPQSKIFVFHFLKIFMISQVHDLLIAQWLPVEPLVGRWFLKNLLLHIHVVVVEEFKSILV